MSRWLRNKPALYCIVCTSWYNIDMESEDKKCSRCGVVKQFSDFHRDKNKADGHVPHCKSCVASKVKAWRENNADRHRESNRQWEERHPDRVIAKNKRYRSSEAGKQTRQAWDNQNRSKVRAYHRESQRRYKARNPEKVLQATRVWRETYPERQRISTKQWEKRNPEKVKARAHRRRSLERGAVGSFTGEEWRELCSRFENRCLCCKKQKSLTVDHILPLSKGGRNDIGNLQPLCYSCNSRKKDRYTDYRF